MTQAGAQRPWYAWLTDGSPPVEFSLHPIVVDGQEATLRVFVPAKPDGRRRPAVVMVCGLMWLGDGFLGAIGLRFNDRFGYAFARSGCPCVQIHTPSRHLAHTRIMDATAMLCLLLWPLLLIPVLRFLLVAVDVLMLATAPLQLCIAAPLLLLTGLDAMAVVAPEAAPLVVSGFWGVLALPAAHILVRALHWAGGDIPWPRRRDYLHEAAAAVKWAQGQTKLLGSDGRLVLCGYSSGGHVAALYGLSAEAPSFAAVVLISGIYGLHTDGWTDGRRWLAPAFNLLFADILGAGSAAAREATSPEAAVGKLPAGRLKGEWYVLNARMELMGLEPFQSILFDASPLCAGLAAKGAVVKRVACGLNHWLLIFNVESFVRPFCEGLAE